MLKCLRSGLLCGCCILLAGAPAHAATTPAATGFLDRVTWGVNEASVRDLTQMGQRDWLEQQLRAPAAPLPAAAQAQSDAMRISREPMAQLVVEMDAQNRAANTLTDPDQRKAARDAYNKDMAELGRQAQARSLLRDLYAPGQLREQMTWFWFNHFNVQAGKRDIRTMVADYEDQAIRPRAWAASATCWRRRCAILPCCAISTMTRMRSAISTRTMRARSWSCTPWASARATARRMCRSWPAS
jgi:hypothetical protein